jgi:hypothetical protein
MSLERFIKDTRAQMAALVGTGAVSAGQETVKSWHALKARAASLGLADLEQHMYAVAKLLEGRGAMAYEPSTALSEAVLTVHDRIEALASTAALWQVEQIFQGQDPAGVAP